MKVPVKWRILVGLSNRVQTQRNLRRDNHLRAALRYRDGQT